MVKAYGLEGHLSILIMKDINKISTKVHFKCKFFKNDVKKQHIFVEPCMYEAVGSLSVMPSLLPHVLRNYCPWPLPRGTMNLLIAS
jgi:hypothetical protein